MDNENENQLLKDVRAIKNVALFIAWLLGLALLAGVVLWIRTWGR
jgi:hypothetical protein